MRLLPRRRGMKDLGPSVDLPINKRLARLAEYPLVVSMAAAALIVNATYGRVPRLVDDSAHYIAIAQGKATTVRAPFSHRILHPFAAQLLATVAHRDLATGFSVVAYMSCFALLLLVALTLRRWGVRPILCFPVLLTPLLLDMTLDAYLPDLFHASLMAGFFYCFGTGKKATAWVLLLAATLARETTLVLCFVILLLEWLWGRRKAALAALAAGIIGIAASWLVVSHSQPDIHGLGSFAYLALKVPYNVLKNWLGVMLWVNTCGWKCSLAYSINLPGWLHLGNIDKVGVCPWEPGDAAPYHSYRAYRVWLDGYRRPARSSPCPALLFEPNAGGSAVIILVWCGCFYSWHCDRGQRFAPRGLWMACILAWSTAFIDGRQPPASSKSANIYAGALGIVLDAGRGHLLVRGGAFDQRPPDRRCSCSARACVEKFDTRGVTADLAQPFLWSPYGKPATPCRRLALLGQTARDGAVCGRAGGALGARL